MKKSFLNLLILLSSIGLVSCASHTRNENAGYGAAAGVAIGLLAGNPLLAVGGGMIGAAAGHGMGGSDEPL